MATAILCPKCAAPVPGADPDDAPHWVALLHALEDDCPYVRCDLDTCRALKTPTTPAHAWAALDHWQTHKLSGGCSHGN